VDAVVDFARESGFRAIRLDTMPEMASAQALYRSAGFHQIQPYADNPPEAICMELRL
jgi:ribosomal protein S18 acetylase RimI-like enzyme